MGGVPWKRVELAALVLYALGFYLVVIRKSLRLSHGTAAAAALTPPVPLPSVSTIAARHTAALRVVQITPGGSTDYARGHFRGI